HPGPERGPERVLVLAPGGVQPSRPPGPARLAGGRGPDPDGRPRRRDRAPDLVGGHLPGVVGNRRSRPPPRADRSRGFDRVPTGLAHDAPGDLSVGPGLPWGST